MGGQEGGYLEDIEGSWPETWRTRLFLTSWMTFFYPKENTLKVSCWYLYGKCVSTWLLDELVKKRCTLYFVICIFIPILTVWFLGVQTLKFNFFINFSHILCSRHIRHRIKDKYEKFKKVMKIVPLTPNPYI